MTLKQSYNSSGEKIYPLVSVDGIIDALGIDDPKHRGKNLIALSLQGLDINPNKVDSSILTVVQDGGGLKVKEGVIDVSSLPVHVNGGGLQVSGNIHSFDSINVSYKKSEYDPVIEYGTLEMSDTLTNGAKLTLMKKGDGDQPESFFSVESRELKYHDVTITPTRFDFFNGVLKGDSTTKTLSTNYEFRVLYGNGALLDVSSNRVSINKPTSISSKLTVGNSSSGVGSDIYGEFKVLNGNSPLLDVSSTMVSINNPTSISGTLTTGGKLTVKSDAAVKGNTILGGTLTTGGKLTVGGVSKYVGSDIYGEFKVLNESSVLLDVSSNRVSINKDTSISGALSTIGKLTVGNGASITGAVSTTGKLTVSNSVSKQGAQIYGDTSISGKLNVGGATTLNSTLTTAGMLTVSNGGAQIYGDTTIKGKNYGNIFSANDSSITNYKPTTINSTLNVTEQTTLASGYNNGIVIHTSNDSLYGKKVIWADNDYLRIKSFKHTINDRNAGIQLLVGGDNIYDGWGNAKVGIDLSSKHTANNIIWTNIITMKPAVEIDGSLTVKGDIGGSFIKHQIIGNFDVDLPESESTIPIESNFISIWGKIYKNTTLNFKLPYKYSGKAFTGFFFMGIKKAGSSDGGKTLIINFKNVDGSVTSTCSESTNNTNGERHLFFIPGWDAAHMIY